jgi:hypothetical protein
MVGEGAIKGEGYSRRSLTTCEKGDENFSQH